MNITALTACTAFNGVNRIAAGALRDVAPVCKTLLDQDMQAPVLIFEDASSRTIEMDYRGDLAAVLGRLQAAPLEIEPDPAAAEEAQARGPGRPKLGVVAREITLLPRHWEWLNGQPGGASVALRKLVEDARRANESKDRMRHAQEITFRFISVMAGNQPGFEEACRALFAGRQAQFDALIEPWSPDVRDHARKLAASAFQQ